MKDAPDRLAHAALLANTEAWAKANGVRYEWEKDDTTNRDFTDEGPEYRLDRVLAWHYGEVIGSLCGIDFGYGVRRNDSPYKRVVEAEIAVEAYLESVEADRCACADIVTA